MDKTLKRIAVILIIIILLPVVFFSIYEISTLNKNEEVLKGVYNKQLDAILYSVNQYSDDIVSSWRSNLNLQLVENNNANEFKTAVDSIIKLNSAIQYLILIDSIKNGNINFVVNKSTNIDVKEIRKALSNAKDKIKRLYTYKRGGFYKIEPIETSINNNFVLLIFLTNDPDNRYNIAGILIDPQKFVADNLSQKIQSVAEDQFIVTVNEKLTGRQIYSTDQRNIVNIQQQKILWLLPNYYLGIKFKGKTVEDLVTQRSKTNLIIILILSALLVFAGIIVFINIKRAIELSQLKADFVSNVSHEIKTPLALISMFAETLEKGRVKTEEKKHEYYSIIIQETNRLGKIVNKILNFSKIEAGKRLYQLKETDLNKVVESVFSSYKFHLQNNGFEFIFDPQANLPLVKADDEAVSEAIINLIDNAIKYSNDNKCIKLSTSRNNISVMVEVKDSGIGISEKDKKKIFEKFFRVSSGDIYNSKGTGLGLTIVKHIMDAHNGKIDLKSELGKGSIFKLVFNINEK